MPTYEYRCRSCGSEFEKFQKITSKPVAKCPSCGSSAERLLSTGAGLVFKGSGFYITDYKRAGEKKPDSGESGKSGGDAAPPKKTPASEAPAPGSDKRKSSDSKKDG